jgi:hypothetical protein
MKKNNWAVAAVFTTICMIVVMSIWAGAYGPIWRAAWASQPADWLGFFGNVIGGFMTLCAAGTAWLAVRMQIRSDREIARLGHFQAMRAIKFRLVSLLENLDFLWKILDETLDFEGTDEEKLSRTTWLQSMLYTLPPETIVADLNNLTAGLDKDRVLFFEPVILRLSNLYKLMIKYSEQKERSDELTWRISDIRMLRLQIALLKDAIEKFEADWAQVFSQHKDIALDNSTYADVIRDAYKLWLKEEASRRGKALA